MQAGIRRTCSADLDLGRLSSPVSFSALVGARDCVGVPSSGVVAPVYRAACGVPCMRMLDGAFRPRVRLRVIES